MQHRRLLENRENWSLIILAAMLVISAFWFRFTYLGYSNLQADEIKALCRPETEESIVDFLLRQRKGPVQFLITCAYRQFDPHFSSELVLRLPFAIANCLAVFACYHLAHRLFDRETGIYAALFFATNGLIIGFARIVQYQSVTLLCTILGIYGFLRAVQDESWKIKGLYLGFIATSIGMLAHFDSFFSIPPMLYLLYLWWKKYRDEASYQDTRKHLIAGFLIFAIPLLIFYVPYALQLAEYQLSYWEKRIATLSPSDTIGLYRLYNPGPVIWVHLAFTALGIFRLRRDTSSSVLFLWFLPPLIFMEGIMTHPATHFYTYLLPLFIVAALGFESLGKLLEKLFREKALYLIQGFAILVFGFLMMISHFILIDHTPEYPWTPRVIWKMELTGKNMGATFGFPYRRNWREIGAWFAENYPTHTPIVSNEYGKIGYFYMPPTIEYLPVHLYPEEMDRQAGIMMLWIEEPRSEIDKVWGIREEDWKAHGQLLQEFRGADDKLLGTVYHVTSEELQAMLPD